MTNIFSLLVSFSLISCSSINHTNQVNQIINAIAVEDLEQLNSRINKISENELNYEINRCEISKYPKEKFLKLLALTKKGIDECYNRSVEILNLCIDKTNHSYEVANCKVDILPAECNVHTDDTPLYEPMVKNCKSGSTGRRLNKPLGHDLKTIILAIVKPKIEQIKSKLISQRSSEEKNKNDKEAIDKQQKQDEYSNSPQFISDVMCNLTKGILRAKNEIQKEGKIGNIGGFVNKANIHKMSSTIVNHENWIEAYKVQYKKLTHENWNFTNCKNK